MSNEALPRVGHVEGQTNLDDDETLAQHKNDRIDPGAPALPDGEDSELRQESKRKKDDVNEGRNYC